MRNYQLLFTNYYFFFIIIDTIIPKKPIMQTIGAIVIRRKLNTSGLNSVVVELPAIRTKPMIINNTDIAIRM